MVGEWKKVRLGDSVNIQRGYAFKSKDYREKGVFVLRVSNLTSSYSVSTENAVFVPETFLQEYKEYQLEEGDILLVMVGATTGKIARVPKQVLPALLNQNLWNLKPQSGWNKDFFFYMIQREIEGFLSKKHGSAREFLKQSEFLELEISCPSLPEQRKIATILSSVDEAIAKTEAIIEQTEKVKKGLMQQLLTKGIGHTKFKKTEIGEIPEEWVLKRIGDLVKFEGGSQPPRSTFIFEPKEGYIRLLQIRDYKTDKYATYIPIELAKKFCNEDDVMIGRYGPPIFQILRGLKGAYNVALIKAIPDENFVTKDYLYYFLKQEPLFKLIDSLSQRTSGQTGIDMDALKNYGFPLPPITEQKKITAILDKVQAKLDKENDYLQQLQYIKKGLMQVLLTGKVRVKVDDEVMSQ